MHSQGLLARASKTFSVFVFMFFLYGCEGTSTDRQLPEKLVDSTEPSIIRVTPESDVTGYEVDFKPTVLFSEQVNIESLLSGGISIYSGKDSLNEEGVLLERDLIIEQETVPGEQRVLDELTGKYISVDATKATLSLASGRFALNNIYTIRVGEGVYDLVEDDLSTSVDERNFMNAVKNSFFTTEPGAWHAASDLNFRGLSSDGLSSESLTGSSFEPILRTTDNGHVVMVWKQQLEQDIQLWASMYSVELGEWVIPGGGPMPGNCSELSGANSPLCVNAIRLDVLESSEVYTPNVSINRFGHVVVVWAQIAADLSGQSVWVNMFNGLSWSGASELSHLGAGIVSDSFVPLIHLTDSGNVIATWIEERDNKRRVRALDFDFNAGFQGAGFGVSNYIDGLNGLETGDAKDLSLTANQAGKGIVLWTQPVGNSDRILGKVFSLNGDEEVVWKSTDHVNSSSNFSATSVKPKSTISESGDISVVWRSLNGNVFDLVFSRNVGGNWLPPEKIENDDAGSVAGVTLAYNPIDELFVSWVRMSQSSQPRLIVRVFHPIDGWSTQEDIPLSGRAGLESIIKPTLIFDFEGNGNLVWIEKSTSSTAVIGRKYDKLAKLWLAEEVLAERGKCSEILDLNLNNLLLDGRMVSVWSCGAISDSSYSLTSALFEEVVTPIN